MRLARLAAACLAATLTFSAPLAAQEIHARLQERVQKLITDAVDPQRLAQEHGAARHRAAQQDGVEVGLDVRDGLVEHIGRAGTEGHVGAAADGPHRGVVCRHAPVVEDPRAE